MASIFTRVLDRITPWNRGGEVQRRNQKKRKDEEEARQRASVQAPRQQQSGPNVDNLDRPLTSRSPVNIFEDLNKNLVLNKPQDMGVVPVNKSPNLQVAQAPKPGTIVQPTTKPRTPEDDVNDGLNAGKSWERISRETNVPIESVRKYSEATRPSYGIKIDKPKQSIGNRIRDVFDANTESDKFRRQEGNNRTRLLPGQQEKPLTLDKPGNIVTRTPVVGQVTKMLNTAGAQIPQLGITVQQQLATREQSAATEELTKAIKSGDKARIIAAKDRANKATDRVTDINRQLDAADNMFEKNKGGLFNAGTLYDQKGAESGDIKTGVKDVVAPTAVSMLDLYTLGRGSAISEGIKQGGLRAGIRSQAPNIIKATAGNYASGDINTRAEGGTNEQAIKAGLLNSILGIIPDVGLPALARGFRNKIIPSIARGRGVAPEVAVNELDDAAISASAEAANQALRPRPIPVRGVQDIPIKVEGGLPEPIPVRTPPRPQPQLIKELSGDFNFPSYEKLNQIRVEGQKSAASEANATARPDPFVEGITPRTPSAPFRIDETAAKGSQDGLIDEYATFLRDVGEGNGVDMVPTAEGGYKRVSNNVRFGDTKGKRMTKVDWRDEAERQLRAGRADPGIQKAFDEANNPEVQALLAKGDQGQELPPGRPIDVKQVNTIPVTDQTVVPTNLPETPGAVRVTEQTAPNNARSEVVAAQTPPSLPVEVQQVLDNPKQFNKRQVAAARNQRKLARQMAKTQEQTAEAMDRIETASPATQSGEGFTPTGEFARSANGGTYQKASRQAEMQQAVQETSQMSNADVLQTARKNQLETGGFNRRDIRNIAALFEQKRIPRGTPEWNEARAILKEDGTVWGQTGALRNYTMRRNATTDELISRYESKIYRLADDPTKIDGKWFDDVEVAENAYVTARDDAARAFEEFNQNPTSANAKRYHAAQDAAENADRTAKQVEFKVASKALKGNKDIKQVRELDKLADDADLYQMDAVDASMLSGTGTFIRNFVNSAVGGVEEGLFGKAASRLASLTKKSRANDVKIGGGFGRGTISGFGEGVDNLRSVAGARASNAGKNPLGHLKNWATTGNQLGDTIIDSQTKHNVLDHYRQVLKDQGYTGRELTDRASVMARQDPDNLAREYAGAARVAAGLGQGITRNNKVETLVKNVVSDAVSAGKPTPLSEATGKLVARMTIGFPTAIGRSTVEGVKRFTLGAPTFVKALREADPTKRALLVKEGIKQAGTGGIILPPAFYALGAAGMISGAYPPDKETRAQWEREGKTENSIKIGGAWYQLPAYLGAWAVPGLFYASLGRNGGNISEATADVAKAVPSILPTDQASNIMDVVNGRTDLGKFMAQMGASTVRAVTPAGALLNQISKSFDPTKNDTNSGSNWENFLDKVASGIPGINNAAGIPDKVSDTGDSITNPNPLEILAGAASDVQGKGEERSREIQSQTDTNLKKLTDTGLFDDPNIKEVLDGKELATYNKIKSGKPLKEGELEDLKKAFVKGVSATGDDTAYLEREQYDSNLRALRLKRELMSADKSVKPSDIKKVDVSIKRGEVYKQGKVPYEMIDAYKSTGVEEWRKMGDPEADEYDPDMYQKLYDIDHQLTEKGVSYKKGALDKPKYTAKETKGRKGGAGSRGGAKQIDTDFGTLKSSGPKVQEYASIDSKSGSVPIIRRVRPNIVHNISSSR